MLAFDQIYRHAILFVAGMFVTGAFIDANAQQVANCPAWVPTIYNEGGSINLRDPRLAPMHRVGKIIDSMVKKNVAFNGMPEARFRTALSIARTNPHGADYFFGVHVNAKAYVKKGWDNKCGLIPQADRIASDKAGISFYINSAIHLMPNQFDNMNGDLERIGAFVEPEFLGTFADNVPLYRSGITKQEFAMLTYTGRVPWIPLTVREYYGTVEIDIKRKIEDFNLDRKRKQDHSDTATDKDIRETYEAFKKNDPKQAEEYLVMMKNIRAQRAIQKEKMAKHYVTRDSALQKELRDFRQYVASLTPQQLQQPAILGNYDHSRPYDMWKEGSKGVKRPLVKLAPEYLTNPGNRNVIRLITIWRAATVPKWKPFMKEAWETLDFKLLRGFLEVR
jgi:hypothetical protein